MKLFYGVLFITLSVLLFAIILIGARNPQSKMWKADALVANVYIPLIVALSLFGICFLVQYTLTLNAASWNWREAASAGAVALGGVGVMKALQIKKRLAKFTALEAREAAVVVEIKRPEEKQVPPTTDRRAA